MDGKGGGRCGCGSSSPIWCRPIRGPADRPSSSQHGRCAGPTSADGGFEIEFGEVLAAAIDDAAGIVQEPDSKQVTFCLTEEGALVDVRRLLPHSRHAAVLSAWARLEETLKELVQDADIGTGEGTARTLALAALGEGLISKTTFDAINRLARLRDLTANGLAEPHRSQAEEFIEVVMTVLYAIYVANALRESAEARAQDGYRPSPP